jgi:hypothetical protein
MTALRRSALAVALVGWSAAQPYNVSVRVWPRHMGDPIEMTLAVDGKVVGSLSNLQGPPALRVTGLNPGLHTFELTHINVYAGLGSKVSELHRKSTGRRCSGTFQVVGPRGYALRMDTDSKGTLTCALQ